MFREEMLPDGMISSGWPKPGKHWASSTSYGYGSRGLLPLRAEARGAWPGKCPTFAARDTRDEREFGNYRPRTELARGHGDAHRRPTVLTRPRAGIRCTTARSLARRYWGRPRLFSRFALPIIHFIERQLVLPQVNSQDVKRPGAAPAYLFGSGLESRPQLG